MKLGLLTPPTGNKKKRTILVSMVIASVGITALFIIDGGMGLLTAGIIEVVKWACRWH